MPPLEELEAAVCNVVAEQTGIARDRLRLDSRLIEDLHIDSLDLVELTLALEDRFGVSIPDDSARLPFVTGSVTIGDLARIVEHQWGTGTPPRDGWFASVMTREQPSSNHFTQLAEQPRRTVRPGTDLHERIAPTKEGLPQFRRSTDGMRCVLLPEARVELGSDAPDALPDQRPLHRAQLSSFLMDAEPVSTTAYCAFLNSVEVSAAQRDQWCGVGEDDRRRRHFQLAGSGEAWRPRPGTERQPMILASWSGANAYSRWANGREPSPDDPQAVSFLPSEAQWEYAARGTTYQRFPWGAAPCTSEWALVGLHRGRTRYGDVLPLADVSTPLGVSPWGVHHMAGNVWNWCRDWYAPEFHHSTHARENNPVNLTATGIRSERGGSWVGPSELALVSYRRGRPPHARGRCLGFRCVGALPT